MGEVIADILLENTVDKELANRKQLADTAVRSFRLKALVDTGAVMLALPQDVVEKLGLSNSRKVIVSYADERREERPVAGPVTLYIGDRFLQTECLVLPPNAEALIGQIPLETLDLLVDNQRQQLIARPESPIYPSLKLK